MDDIVAKGMAKRPEDRYPTAGELAGHLGRVAGRGTARDAERGTEGHRTTDDGGGPDGDGHRDDAGASPGRFLTLLRGREAWPIVGAVVGVLCLALAGLLVFGPRSGHSTGKGPSPGERAPGETSVG